MSLLFDKTNPNEPQTHIFMIGVGGYPYLRNGSKSIPQKIDIAQELGQLTSPQVSLEAFYNNVINLHNSNSWVKPLGSIEVLLSKAPSGKEVFINKSDIESATRLNIDNAYFRWKNRCDSHPDNVAIFFFCGHGIEKIEHYLLTEDFGERPENPWSGSFAFDSTRRAFHTCKANTQLFLIDSCRQVTIDLLRLNLPSNPIESPDITCPDCKYDLTQKASATTESSYGRMNEPTFYTKALINALQGRAATNINGWQIDIGTLAHTVDSLIENRGIERNYIQRCRSNILGNVSILKFQTPPNVVLNVTCSPDKALSFADLSCVNLNTQIGLARGEYKQSPWNVNLKAGVYKFQANFPGKEYKDSHHFSAIEPCCSLHTEILQTPQIK